MPDSIANILQRDCNLHAKNLLLLGVSGGPDSLYLLHVLHGLGYKLIATHVNHGLRAEADAEESLVEQFARQLGVEFISTREDARAYSQEHTFSIEEAARIVRYRYLFEQADGKAASAVLVAHTADDQVETILMHLLRGSGLAGLRGMQLLTLPNPWSQRIPLVRPLLSTWRVDIMTYLEQHNIQPTTDSSNLDTTYFRNRLRHELLPYLEAYNPRFRKNLLRQGQIVQADYEVIMQQVKDAWNATLVKEEPDLLSFHQSAFLMQPIAIRRYLLRHAIAYHYPSLRDIDFECIERGLQFLAHRRTHGQVDLMVGLRLVCEGELFWLVSGQAGLPVADFPAILCGGLLTLDIPGVLSLNDGWQLTCDRETDIPSAIRRSSENSDPYHAWLDASGLEFPLIVRCRKPGDALKPLGMAGHSMKISDLMINRKIPARARRTWPLLCSGAKILWVPGCRQGEIARVGTGSRSVVHLSLLRHRTA
jgi:tRNA(Ile)-lysidine synthase